MRKPTKEEIKWLEKSGIKPEECSCIQCPDNDFCKFAFDPYNTDDDCLQTK